MTMKSKTRSGKDSRGQGAPAPLMLPELGNITQVNPIVTGFQQSELESLLYSDGPRDFDAIMRLAERIVPPQPHISHGFYRIAAASPEVEIGNCLANAKGVVRVMKKAAKKRVKLLLLPELIINTYTSADLFFQESNRRSALRALEIVRLATLDVFKGVVVVGVAIEVDGVIYNSAVAMQGGEYLGVVPKSYLPTYGEFDEYRWFALGHDFKARTIVLNGRPVRMGINLLFQAVDFPGLIFGIEICEDGWAVIPPHRLQALAGAVVILNLSTSNELAGKDDYRRDFLIKPHSAQAICAYGYASSGEGESTTDMVPGGHCAIGENGAMLAEVPPFSMTEPFCVADVDIDHLLFERLRNSTYREERKRWSNLGLLDCERIPFRAGVEEPFADLLRFVDAHPFVPADPATRDRRLKLITEIQVRGLKKRFKQIAKKYGGIKKFAKWLLDNNKPLCVIGVSGGLDSTHALNIVIRVLDELGVPRSLCHGYTMPGFGTTKRTYDNAIALMRLTGITVKEVDIRARCLQAWLDEGYKPFGIDLNAMRAESQKKVKAALAADPDSDADLMSVMLQDFGELLKKLPAGSKDLVFENKQARARTDILMNAGFVIGTGDLSELAVGWCTYNGDHMAMYGVNAGIPKTLVHFLVKWAAHYWFDGELRKVLIDIAETEVSPELLPPGPDGKIAQKTNALIGPADLRDFFLYHMRRWGSSPEKIIYLATFAKFNTPYTVEEIRHWLKVFIERFFEQRYKHSCLPDGPKVGSISLSPRYDWHMPSDASPDMYLAWVVRAEKTARRREKAAKKETATGSSRRRR